MRTRIGTLAIVSLAAVSALTIGVMAVLVIRTHRDALTRQIERGADQLCETISSSTYYDMLENRRDDLHQQIALIGRQKGIERVRVFSRIGTITFSSDEKEIGRSVDKKAEACFACHAADRPLEKLSTRARSRIYRGADGQRVLGMIRPIANRPGCWTPACHAHRPDEAVLGVLDVNLSLAEVDRQIAGDQRQMLWLAALAIGASSLLLWWLNRRLIVGPVAALIAGTRKVAEGDLSTQLPAEARHELGDLARAFNDMTRRLADAQRQLTQADKLASVGRLAAGVAHEINNPLTGVLTYASFLQKRAGSDPDLQRDLEVIVRETRRCREIVKNLLDFSRQARPVRQPTDLNEVARRGVGIVMNQLALDRVQLGLDLARDLPPLPADANQIEQIVVNLLLNAADALGGAGGSIRLTTRRADVPPRGNRVIRAASCPKGCDLLDPAVRIHGYPAIRVNRRIGDDEVTVHLDPLYGGARHQTAPCDADVVAGYRCPRCRTKLDLEGARCGDCGAPVFSIGSGPGRVEWCTRKGCHWTRWEAEEALGPRPVAELEVEDTGRGIAEEEMRHLFEPFFTTKGSRGVGLGLAVTWGIVERHGGTIEVAGREGQGARFTIRLPYEVAEAGEATTPDAGEAPASMMARPGALPAAAEVRPGATRVAGATGMAGGGR
jgi:two-component system NtrC family sensor kinase